MYGSAGGTGWYNNTGRQDKTPSHCKWFGVSCNDDGFVSKIDLSKNNLTGRFLSLRIGGKVFDHLRYLNLAGNNLFGNIDYFFLYRFRSLEHIDASENKLTGEVDILPSPSVEYLNFSYNNFSSVGQYQKFKASYHTLQTCDLSYNNIEQHISEILHDTPPSIEELLLTENLIHGALPNPLPALERLRRFHLNKNLLSGTIPAIPRSFPLLRELNLSMNKNNRTDNDRVGLSGMIPMDWSNLPDIRLIDLSHNKLTDEIPPGIGNLPELKVLNVSDNMLSNNFIPTELGKLAGSLEVFDARNNILTGLIPSQLSRFDTSLILLGGNNKM